jgi:hypothetical protein
MYRSTLSLASVLDSGGWLTSRAGRFTPGTDPVPITQEAGWAPGLVRTGSVISPSQGFDPRAVQSLDSGYTDKVIPADTFIIIKNYHQWVVVVVVVVVVEIVVVVEVVVVVVVFLRVYGKNVHNIYEYSE